VMILASATVTAVPADEREPIFAGATSVESDLRSTSDTVSVGGSVWLSPKVRFTVQADDPAYWRVKAYDRFTGTGWTRTGNSVPLSEADWPPGPRQAITQRVTAMTTLDVLPAAGEPTRVSGIDARLTPQGTLTGGPTLSENDSYTVVSRVPNATGSQLRDAGTDYPEPVRERYLQLPESTPDRVANLTDRITADAESPYDATRSVERWLEANKNYSTTVPQPDGDIANTFLFQRDAGYCVYFATTMATMLRSQDIPARYVVGYTPGQRVAEDEWVVRGLDSHAWVEVYFPEYGWIPFDPTPGSDRSSSETDRLEEARDEGVEGVDAAGSENGTWTPTTTVNASGSLSDELDPDLFVDEEGESIFPGNETTTVTTASPSGFGAANVSGLVNGTTTAGGDASSDFSSPALDTPGPVRVPGLRTLALWSVLLVGLAAGGRRSGVAERAYRAAWVRWQPATGDHRRAVEGAYDRVEYLLGREHRPRQDGETVREFLDAVEADERVRELAALRERARYAGEVDAEAARRARELADAVVGERVGVATRFNRLLS
jgi:transglutaminase-like putative cysteine protease